MSLNLAAVCCQSLRVIDFVDLKPGMLGNYSFYNSVRWFAETQTRKWKETEV